MTAHSEPGTSRSQNFGISIVNKGKYASKLNNPVNRFQILSSNEDSDAPD